MHVVIGVLTALAGLIWAIVALQKAGVSISAFNPFLWHRRMNWKNNISEKPLYTLSDPMEVAAVLILGVAKCEGEISAEQKIPLPLTQATATTFQMALAGGYGDESKGALIKVFEDILKVKFRKKER